VLEKVLRVSAVRSWPYLVAKPSPVGVQVDGISYRPRTNATWSNHPMWDGVGFTLSLSRGEETPEVVHLALVEKVRVLGGRIVSAMRVKGEKPFSPDMKSLESSI
jgi:hypothetical protein